MQLLLLLRALQRENTVTPNPPHNPQPPQQKSTTNIHLLNYLSIGKSPRASPVDTCSLSRTRHANGTEGWRADTAGALDFESRLAGDPCRVLRVSVPLEVGAAAGRAGEKTLLQS